MSRPAPNDPRRSRLMAQVRQKDTAAERRVALILRGLGIFYRKNVRSLPGSPDLANKHKRWAIFVQGCFWHHHRGCRRATVPKTNQAFWVEKFGVNRRRDAHAVRALRRDGYRVAFVWECELDRPEALAKRLSEILETRCIDVC
ncbi:very short patch repair endonuclease [Ensifer adhaerens]|uniref:very short patch repair endonuclease n=1 Tax=Ensifer adhaerens TaxID=106592 RepID=UPI003D0487CA